MRLVDAIAVIGAARQVTVAIVRCGVREDCASDDVTRWINDVVQIFLATVFSTFAHRTFGQKIHPGNPNYAKTRTSTSLVHYLFFPEKIGYGNWSGWMAPCG